MQVTGQRTHKKNRIKTSRIRKSLLYAAVCICYVLFTLPNSSYARPQTIHLVATETNLLESRQTPSDSNPHLLLLQEAFKRLGYKTTISQYPWNRALEMAKSGQIDAVATTIYTEERADYLNFCPEPLGYTNVSMFIRKNDQTVPLSRSLAEYSSFTIGAIRGYSYGPEIDSAIRFGLLPIMEYTASFETSLRQLLAHRTDVLIGYNSSVWNTAERLGIEQKIETIDKSFRSYPIFVAFSKQNPNAKLYKKLSPLLRKMKQDGTFQQIVDGQLMEPSASD